MERRSLLATFYWMSIFLLSRGQIYKPDIIFKHEASFEIFPSSSFYSMWDINWPDLNNAYVLNEEIV